jgi:hypothetical protein
VYVCTRLIPDLARSVTAVLRHGRRKLMRPRTERLQGPVYGKENG